MPTYTPSRAYPHVGGDRLVADRLNHSLEFSPGPLPPTNPNPLLGSGGAGAGQFKYWVDTTDALLPVLRQCIAPRATAGVYIPSEWLTLGTLDIAAAKFHFNGDQVNFSNLAISGPVTLDTLTVTGATTLNSLSVTGDLNALNATLTGTLTAVSVNTGPLTATGNISSTGVISAPTINSTSLLTASTIQTTHLLVTDDINAGTYTLNGHLFADSDTTSVSIFDPGGTARLVLYTTGTNFYRNNLHIFEDNASNDQMVVSLTGVTITGPLTVNSGGYQLNGTTFVASSGSQLLIYDTAAVLNMTLYNTGDNYYDNTRHNFRSRGGGAVTFAQFDNTGSYNPSGSWTAISDASLKEFVAPYRRGLDAIVQLQPVEFAYKAGVFSEAGHGAAAYVGLLAEDVKPVLPEICGVAELTLDKQEMSVDTIRPTQIVFALINAVKELAARVIALEGVTHADTRRPQDDDLGYAVGGRVEHRP